MSKKRTNPRRRPATQADVNRAKDFAMREAANYATAIMLSVLLDKFNAKDYISDVWREVNKLAESIVEGRVSVADLQHTLKEEYGIEL
jgi:hypothetical protein